MQDSYDAMPHPDGNFLRDFQTTGFDARVWELYLHAYFRSIGCSVSRPADRPDFLLDKDGIQVWVEAVTANPTQGVAEPTITQDEHWSRVDAVAIKLGSPLWSKLKNEYCTLPTLQESHSFLRSKTSRLGKP